MTKNVVRCLCGASNWGALPDPFVGRCVTTDGHILKQSLTKAQCMGCGLVRRMVALDRPLADFYSDEYAVYNRPGAQDFDASRYQSMARWIGDATIESGGRPPKKVIEIGCGTGWALQAMRALYPDAEYTGIEPSAQAAQVARAAGFTVLNAVAGVDALALGPEFDLVYSNNVIEHTPDPGVFLQGMKQLLHPNGRIVISCPDGSYPALDMMFADHVFTFLPMHLMHFAEAEGLVPLLWKACPKGRLRHEQLMVASVESVPIRAAWPEPCDPAAMLRARREYFTNWSKLDDYFHEAMGEMKNIYLFGAGEWGFLLSGYAPRTWKRIGACTVDNYQGSFLGKTVMSYDTLKSHAVDGIIIGTNPDSQPILARRLAEDGYRTITWNHLVNR